MNIHLFSDNLGFYTNKTVERIINLQPTQNIFFNLTPHVEQPNSSVKVCDIDFLTQDLLSRSLINKIILHYNSPAKAKIVARLKKKFPHLKVYWCFWSSDYYNISELRYDIYSRFSRSFLFSNPKEYAKIFVYQYLNRILIGLGLTVYTKKSYFRSFKNIDYFCCLLANDYLNVKLGSNAKFAHLDFAYLSLEQILPKERIESAPNIGNQIMIGHSSSPDGNHYEIIEILSRYQTHSKFLMPLAYGNMKYKAKIKAFALEKFGNNVEILESFMNTKDYYEYLNRVGFAIINTAIQQGIGTIMGMIWNGTKIFLQENNSVYQDFKSWGMHIFSIEKDIMLGSSPFESILTESQINHNRMILKAKLSDEIVNEYFLNMLKA